MKYVLSNWLLQMLGEENSNLEKKMAEMKEKLQEAKEEMEKTTDDYIKLKMVVQSSDKMVDDLRRENEMLRDQVNTRWHSNYNSPGRNLIGIILLWPCSVATQT